MFVSTRLSEPKSILKAHVSQLPEWSVIDKFNDVVGIGLGVKSKSR